MKKYIYISAIAACMAGLTLTSCSDFLDPVNKTSGGQTADDTFSKNANTLLTTVYSNLRSIVYNPALFCQGTDLYVQTRGKTAGEFNEYTLTPENGTVESYYINCYKMINRANGVINYAGEESQLGYEARFLRDLGYFKLTQQFGSVPYVTTYINDANRNYPRTDLKEIYNGLITDLETLYSSSTLADTDHTGRASKQAVAALLAKIYLAAGWDLDTSVSDITKGTYSTSSTANFTKAAEWAEKAINGVQLTMTFDNKWSPSNEGNAEEIFSVQYERAGFPGDETTGGHSMQNNFGGYYGNCSTTGMKNVGSENSQSEKAMYLYEKGDNRYEATFMTHMYNATITDGAASWGDEGYYAYYNSSKQSSLPWAHVYFPYYVTEAEAEAEFAANPKKFTQGSYGTEVTAAILTAPNVIVYSFNADGTVKKKITQNLTDVYNVQTSNGVCVKKFDDPNSGQYTDSNDYRDIVVFHVSEMYLVAAEAYFMAGQTQQALTKINAVRGRAGLASLSSFSAYQPEYSTSSVFSQQDIDLILDERARELYAEGYRWEDLRRTKQLVRYNVEFNMYVSNAAAMANNAGEYRVLRPIPQNEIALNESMTSADQNPGY